MINKLGGETLSPYLSLCSMDAICSKNMLSVVAIMEDYMVVEYVGFANQSSYIDPLRESRIRGCPDDRTITFGRTPGL